jgi:predicted alpha/beta-hydrolase family hydrolase
MGAGGAAGLLREGPVHVASTHSREVVSSPQTFADRVARIPNPEQEGGAQVVVEKYSQPGTPDRFEVYIGGTVTFDPVASTEPFDLTSNFANAAGRQSGAYRSVVEAMRLAGVTDTSPVQFTGYSQGGATAALLAASGDYSTAGLTTFGAPAGEIVVPDSVPTVVVEHTDDLVPALGGTQKNGDAVTIRREVFGGRELPDRELVPAHDLRYYAETARLMDSARSDQVVGAARSLESFASGATTVTSTVFTFARGTATEAGASSTFP